MLRFIRPTVPEPDAWLPHLRISYERRVFANSGPAALRFEAALADRYAGTDREVVLVANCTCGIAAALLAAGASGRVVVPAFTFPATAQAVLQSGCLPVFCDVSRETWEMDPGALEEVLARYRASAVVHVRAFGFCRDLEAIEAVAERYGARLIVDGAAALGGRLESGAFAGRQGDAEAFSMHVTKVFGIGEGGVVFASRRLATRLRQACNFGLAQGDVVMRGLNAKLSDFHAAIGLALLDRIDGYIDRRREVARRYGQAFASCAWASHPVNIGVPPMQMYPLLVASARHAEALVETSLPRGVELRRYYRPALHQASAFASFERGHLEIAEDLASRIVCLPVYSDMTDAEIDIVIDTVKGAI
ncbi:MAG TPA: aminotransferase class I/II-fold pyridoxal phosphate-dependent enzyme [Thermoanaerobaculia bacterium]|nr:aminotransferase class I/II-fold pyridoxal phosphate-dependent enzyme [Thermoanaerobaculia bacterium]